MRIALLCLGSEGDVRIFVTLGLALKKDGHEVVIASNPATEKLCVENGLEFLPLAGDLNTVLNVDKEAVGYGKLQIVKLLVKVLNEAIHDQFTFLEKKLREVDAVLYHPAVFAAPHLFEALSLPGMCVLFLPEVPTRHHASCLFPSRMPFKKLSHYIMGLLFWMPVRGAVNRFRKTLGLKKLGYFAPLTHSTFTRIPKLVTVSSALIVKPKDWPSNVHITGYLHSPKAEGYVPPASLQKFLEEGEPPVFIGFGSLGKRCDEKMARAIVNTLKEVKVRAILGGSFPGLTKEDMNDRIFLIERAPYDWLFPRVRAVVHHGGTGTVHCTLKDGRSSLVVPFLLDQFYWGEMIHRIGAGPAPLPAKKFTQKAFTTSLLELIDTPAYAERALALSKQMEPEDGVRDSLKYFYDYLKNTISV